MEAASEHLALPLLQVWARCKRGLKPLQFHRLLPAQDNISSSTSSFLSGHAQSCWDLSSLVQSSQLKPLESSGEERRVPVLQAARPGMFQTRGSAQDLSPHTMVLPFEPAQAGKGLACTENSQRETPGLVGVRGSWDCPGE